MPAMQNNPNAECESGPRAQSRIYLDCDGVLADFEAGALAIFGIPSQAFERQFGLKRFWAELAAVPDFFGRLDPMVDARSLFEAVRHRHPLILTGLPRGAWAAPQKRAWAQRHFAEVEVITTTSALKSEHCHPGDALVDDRDKYRGLWERAGGVFIHHRDAETSIAQLRELGLL